MSQNKKYLYGASVQGIQSFIFQTDTLRDIVGASALVDYICTECFNEFAENQQIIVSAAGNIKCIFDSEEQCRKAVREFPRKAMSHAPGITISEAVVPIDIDTNFVDAISRLEEKLRTQRNKPFPILTLGMMGMERSRKTGLPAVKYDKNEPIDIGTWQKRKASDDKKQMPKLYTKFFGEDIAKDVIAHDVSHMTVDNSWLAVIHADGNGLGQIIPYIGKDKEIMTIFSHGLDIATTKAAHKAYESIAKNSDFQPSTGVLPFRPVVLGGDDLTLICRADLAVDFVKIFISLFEKYTGELLDELRSNGAVVDIKCLTACAGIAFIKESYPFYYGYQLAERLCDEAKRDAKNWGIVPAPSCLMFHKVQSSFVEDYQEIVHKELMPDELHSYQFGPYYLAPRDERWMVDELQTAVSSLFGKDGNALKSDIREWMTLMAEEPEKAKQKGIRVKAISSKQTSDRFELATSSKKRTHRNKEVCAYPAYDILSLFSVSSIVTKHKNNTK